MSFKNRTSSAVLFGAILSACGQGSAECDQTVDSDGDGVDDCAEVAEGLDPESRDTDGDGFSDGEELDCGSDPLNEGQQCLACGWNRADPGDLVATGNEVGDIIANISFIDQCEEEVSLWDFAEEYHILWMTASW